MNKTDELELTLNECIDLVEEVYNRWEREEIELMKNKENEQA